MGDDSNESGVSPEASATFVSEGVGVMNNVIRIDEDRIKGHLDRIVRSSVEDGLLPVPWTRT